MMVGVCCAFTAWVEKDSANYCITLDLHLSLKHYFISIRLTDHLYPDGCGPLQDD